MEFVMLISDEGQGFGHFSEELYGYRAVGYRKEGGNGKRNGENYLLQSLSSVIAGTVQDSENRIARMDFKLAVELSKLSQVIAYTHEVDDESLEKLHAKCVGEVRRINGAIEFESAYKYQRREK